MLKEQAELLKELSQMSRKEEAKRQEENSEEKKEIKLGLFGL